MRACRICAGPVQVFYEAHGVPVTSCTLMDDPATARDLPTGDLRLVFCGACGFIANDAFDHGAVVYDEAYEETQGCSPRFRAFAEDLAGRWIDRFDLRRRRILEVGCGKGEFLALLADLGDNDCLGVDPTVDPHRVPRSGRGRVEVLAERYSPAHADPPVDAIVCRHTLEHVGDVVSFLRDLRVGAHASTVMLFELPDTERILLEGAVEDVYYEHASYFTAGSLSRLFRRCGFEVLGVSLEYEGQYLVLEARPAHVDTSLTAEDRADVARTAGQVERFRQAQLASAGRWRTMVLQARDEGRRVVLWGGSSKAVAFLTTLDLADAVDAVVDVNPHKHGKAVPGTGHPVVSPCSLRDAAPDLVILMNAVYFDEVRGMLTELGLSPQLVALGAQSSSGRS
jgi:hypothetical protein